MIACVTHTPLPDVWDMSLGVIVRYSRTLPQLLPLLNPFAAGVDGESDKAKTITDPAHIRAWASSMGIKRCPPK